MSVRFRDLRAWKYKLVDSYQINIGIKTPADIETPVDRPFVRLHTGGGLDIMAGYTWDGPSGPTPDFKCSMRSSLVHDALYQLLRSCKLESHYRPVIDGIMRDILIMDGMPIWLAYIYWIGVRLFAARYARPQLEQAPAIRTAP